MPLASMISFTLRLCSISLFRKPIRRSRSTLSVHCIRSTNKNIPNQSQDQLQVKQLFFSHLTQLRNKFHPTGHQFYTSRYYRNKSCVKEGDFIFQKNRCVELVASHLENIVQYLSYMQCTFHPVLESTTDNRTGVIHSIH